MTQKQKWLDRWPIAMWALVVGILVGLAGVMIIGRTAPQNVYIATGGATDNCGDLLINEKVQQGQLDPNAVKVVRNCYNADMSAADVNTTAGANSLVGLIRANCPPSTHCIVEGFSMGTMVVAKAGAIVWGPGKPAPSNIIVITDGNPYAGTPGNGPGLTKSPYAPFFMPQAQTAGIPATDAEPQIPGSINRTSENDFWGNGGSIPIWTWPAVPADAFTINANHYIPDPSQPHRSFVDGNGVNEEIYNTGTDPYVQAANGNPAESNAPAPPFDPNVAPPGQNPQPTAIPTAAPSAVPGGAPIPSANDTMPPAPGQIPSLPAAPTPPGLPGQPGG